MPDWTWNERLNRYQDADTGRIMAFSAVQDLVDQIVDIQVDNVTTTLNNLLLDQRINVATWKQGMARSIKNTYIQQAVLAAGGRDQMTPQMWGVVGGRIRRQYAFLDRFAQQIEDGELTPGQIQMRSDMYINSSRQTYWRIRTLQEAESGSTEERWIPIGDDSTCSPCSDAGRAGWQPLGTFAEPGSGAVTVSPPTQCQGLTNCRCRKEYR